jgi:hypothetical protein
MTLSIGPAMSNLEPHASYSGGSPVHSVTIGKREFTIRKINAKNKKVGWYIRGHVGGGETGPFKTLKAAKASLE